MYKQKVCKKQNTEYILFAVLFISFFLLIGQLNGSNWENDSENQKDELGTSKIDSIFNSESNSITSPNFNTRSTKKLEGISQWDSNVLASYPFKTSGCTIGDLDLSRDGNEIVTVNGDGQVAMVYKTKSNIWESITLWQGQGELITPVIGNFYPDHDGNELIVVGMAIGDEAEIGAGQATMIYGSGDNWDHAVMYLAPNMLHGAAVGDLDLTREGEEVIVMSFGFDVEMLTWNGTEPDEWTVTHMWHAEGKVRKGLIDNLDPNHEGNELVVVDKSGNCTMISGSGSNWEATTLWTDPGVPGLARITAGEVLSDHSGKELVVGGDSNKVGIIWRTGNTWDGKVIFTDSDKIRGVGVADVDPTHRGNEVLVFGYSNNVTMLTESSGTWKSRVIFTDAGRSHDLAVGEADPDHDGPEIVIVGYSKNVTMLSVSPWIYDVLSTYESKTSGCTIGDLDLTRDGNEIVTVNGDGLVAMVYQTESGTWESIELWQGQGELITPVIGNFYPEHDGNELIVVGMAIGVEAEIGAGQATMIYGSGDNWDHAVMYLAPNMLHGAAVGDLDLNHKGDEVIVMSFGFDVEMLTWNGTEPDEWTVTHMWHAEGKVRKGIIDDLDPNNDGNELVVVDKSGNCTMIYGSGTDWTVTTLWADPGVPGLARVTAGEVLTDFSGKEIVVGGDSNNVGIIWRTGNTWDGEVIFTDSDKIRGVGIGDVDPSKSGNEILVFGYSNNVTMLTGGKDNWKSEVIFIDKGRSHDLALGECYPEHDGQELVITGYSKNVTMIYNIGETEPARFSIYGYPLEQTTSAGSTVEFNIGALATGGFNELVHFSTEELPNDISANFLPTSLIPDSSAKLKIDLPISNQTRDIKFKVIASSGELIQEVELKLKILGDIAPPLIDRTFPEDEAEEISPDAPVVIWFNEPMDQTTLTKNAVSIIEDESRTEYMGDLQYDQNSNMLIISEIKEDISAGDGEPSGLPYSKLIKITLDTSISDIAGNKLASKYQFKYLTQKKPTPTTIDPNIKGVYPSQDSTGIPHDSPIVILFNAPMDSSTLNWSTIKVSSDDGMSYTGTISFNTEILTLSITNIETEDGTQLGFSNDTKILVMLDAGIETIAGKPLENTYTWSFSTGVDDSIDTNGKEEDENTDALVILATIVIVILVLIILLLLLALMKSKKPFEDKQEKVDEPKKPSTKRTSTKKTSVKKPPSSRK